MKRLTRIISIAGIIIFAVLAIRCETIDAQHTDDYKGVWMTVNLTGPVSGDSIIFNILLPEGYCNEGEGFPVIYNLHGRGGSYDCKANMIFGLEIEKAITEGILPPVIAVFPNGTKSGWYADSKDGSILIETHIIREILPWVDRTFNTKASREFRVIQGFSMGGYGASLMAVKFPELFSVCLNWDGAMWYWKTMTVQSRSWPPVAPFMFGNDSVYYNLNSSPWSIAERNRDEIIGQVQFRTIEGALRGSGREDTRYPGLKAWQEHLMSLGIEMDYVETGCGHNLACLHKKAGEAGFRLIAEHFKRAGRKQDINEHAGK